MRSKISSKYYSTVPYPPREELSGTNVLSQAALASAFFLYKCFMVARSNNLCSLGPRHIQHSRCNTLHSLNTENKEHWHEFIWRVYLQRWAHHKQRSGDCKSHSNVGSTISPRDIKCGFHTEDFLQLIGSCFKQEQSEIGGKIKCS